ncbi:MAG: CAP domain-containing protein [Frankiaceae bacterium]|nr:CAP domain-containing protein [Frankiaceae bacterium]MBV9871270.1 CAP domain-containing protein [Frankiaceae bacterium]
MKARLLGAALAAAASVSMAAAVAPSGAAAAGKHPAAASYARSYDAHLLAHSNTVRSSRHTHDYVMNHKLWVIAHAWAKHLAKTGTLAHNPRLSQRISKVCPHWTAIGENVGMVTGTDANTLFQAYMRSPEHRANILSRHYRQVGIATVKTTVNGQVVQWDVMDFGNHC